MKKILTIFILTVIFMLSACAKKKTPEDIAREQIESAFAMAETFEMPTEAPEIKLAETQPETEPESIQPETVKETTAEDKALAEFDKTEDIIKKCFNTADSNKYTDFWDVGEFGASVNLDDCYMSAAMNDNGAVTYIYVQPYTYGDYMSVSYDAIARTFYVEMPPEEEGSEEVNSVEVQSRMADSYDQLCGYLGSYFATFYNEPVAQPVVQTITDNLDGYYFSQMFSLMYF